MNGDALIFFGSSSLIFLFFRAVDLESTESRRRAVEGDPTDADSSGMTGDERAPPESWMKAGGRKRRRLQAEDSVPSDGYAKASL